MCKLTLTAAIGTCGIFALSQQAHQQFFILIGHCSIVLWCWRHNIWMGVIKHMNGLWWTTIFVGNCCFQCMLLCWFCWWWVCDFCFCSARFCCWLLITPRNQFALIHYVRRRLEFDAGDWCDECWQLWRLCWRWQKVKCTRTSKRSNIEFDFQKKNKKRSLKIMNELFCFLFLFDHRRRQSLIWFVFGFRFWWATTKTTWEYIWFVLGQALDSQSWLMAVRNECMSFEL